MGSHLGLRLLQNVSPHSNGKNLKLDQFFFVYNYLSFMTFTQKPYIYSYSLLSFHSFYNFKSSTKRQHLPCIQQSHAPKREVIRRDIATVLSTRNINTMYVGEEKMSDLANEVFSKLRFYFLLDNVHGLAVQVITGRQSKVQQCGQCKNVGVEQMLFQDVHPSLF